MCEKVDRTLSINPIVSQSSLLHCPSTDVEDDINRTKHSTHLPSYYTTSPKDNLTNNRISISIAVTPLNLISNHKSLRNPPKMCCFNFQEYIQFATCGHCSTITNNLRYIACEEVPAENKKQLIWARPALVWETSVPCDSYCDYYSTQLPTMVNLNCKACREEKKLVEKKGKSLDSPAASIPDEIFSDGDSLMSDVTQVSGIDRAIVPKGGRREPLPTQSEAYAGFLVEVMQYVSGRSGRRALPPQAWVAPVRRHARRASGWASQRSLAVSKRAGSSWRRRSILGAYSPGRSVLGKYSPGVLLLVS